MTNLPVSREDCLRDSPLVKDAGLRLLEEGAHFRAAVREGIAQAGREEFIEEEEMDAPIERMVRS